MSTEMEREEDILRGAEPEAIQGLAMEYRELAERMERDALPLMMSTETEREEIVRLLEAMEGLVMEEYDDSEHAQGKERVPLSLSRILLRIAVYTITYNTGIFPEKYFSDKFVPELDMIVKELVPVNEELEMLIHWMEEGVYDPVKGKYLKTLLFSTCEHTEGVEVEEFAFIFSYSSKRSGELGVKFSWIGSNTEKLTLKLDAAELAPQYMRSSACKVIRMCALCTGMLDEMQGHSIIMKMINTDDIKVKEAEYDFNFEKISPCLDNESYDDSYDSKEFAKTTSGFLFCAASRRYPLHLDSGASYHVCGIRDCLHNFRKLKEPIILDSVEDSELTARHTGDIVHQDVNLKGVLFVPRLKLSAVSVGLLDRQGLMTYIGDGRFSIYNVDKPAIVGYGVLDRVNKDYAFCSMDWLTTGNCERIDEDESELGENEDEGWIVDSLCANHMVGDKTLLSNCIPIRRQFTTASGIIQCTLKGSVRTSTMVLHDVFYCEDIQRKLISVAQLDEKGFMFTFYKRRCEIQLRDPIHSSGYAMMNSRNHYILSEFTEEIPLPEPDWTPAKKRRRGGSKKRSSK